MDGYDIRCIHDSPYRFLVHIVFPNHLEEFFGNALGLEIATGFKPRIPSWNQETGPSPLLSGEKIVNVIESWGISRI